MSQWFFGTHGRGVAWVLLAGGIFYLIQSLWAVGSPLLKRKSVPEDMVVSVFAAVAIIACGYSLYRSPVMAAGFDPVFQAVAVVLVLLAIFAGFIPRRER